MRQVNMRGIERAAMAVLVVAATILNAGLVKAMQTLTSTGRVYAREDGTSAARQDGDRTGAP